MCNTRMHNYESAMCVYLKKNMESKLEQSRFISFYQLFYQMNTIQCLIFETCKCFYSELLIMYISRKQDIDLLDSFMNKKKNKNK